MALGVRLGPHDAEQPVGPCATRAPGFLSVEHEPLAVPDGLGGNGGQVASRIGLGPALGPDLLTGGHAGQETVPLDLGSEGIESGPQQADAVGVDTARRTRPVVLLLKDQPLNKADVPTAIGLGPRHH